MLAKLKLVADGTQSTPGGSAELSNYRLPRGTHGAGKEEGLREGTHGDSASLCHQRASVVLLEENGKAGRVSTEPERGLTITGRNMKCTYIEHQRWPLANFFQAQEIISI